MLEEYVLCRGGGVLAFWRTPFLPPATLSSVSFLPSTSISRSLGLEGRGLRCSPLFCALGELYLVTISAEINSTVLVLLLVNED